VVLARLKASLVKQVAAIAHKAALPLVLEQLIAISALWVPLPTPLEPLFALTALQQHTKANPAKSAASPARSASPLHLNALQSVVTALLAPS